MPAVRSQPRQARRPTYKHRMKPSQPHTPPQLTQPPSPLEELNLPPSSSDIVAAAIVQSFLSPELGSQLHWSDSKNGMLYPSIIIPSTLTSALNIYQRLLSQPHHSTLQ